jgi:hypothetical protein
MHKNKDSLLTITSIQAKTDFTMKTEIATPFNHRWNYRYLYWTQNLRSAESQQVLFAMDLTGRYIR